MTNLQMLKGDVESHVKRIEVLKKGKDRTVIPLIKGNVNISLICKSYEEIISKMKKQIADIESGKIEETLVDCSAPMPVDDEDEDEAVKSSAHEVIKPVEDQAEETSKEKRRKKKAKSAKKRAPKKKTGKKSPGQLDSFFED